jgi:hypothetical protein
MRAVTFGEVEIHLHHDNDTPDNMHQTLTRFRDTLAKEHGLLARRCDDLPLMPSYMAIGRCATRVLTVVFVVSITNWRF